MRLRYFEYRKGRVEIIPMIDVMLFLLVFFIIVTLQMIPDAGVSLQLPRSDQAHHLPHPKITVNLLADGTIRVKGAVLTPAALTALFAADGDPAKTEVTIAADRKVAFQHFVTVMDAARSAGVSDIGVAAQAVPAAGAAPVGAPPTVPPVATPAPAAAPVAAPPAVPAAPKS
jgi:biopolymer transport protein ExbD